MNSYTIIAIMKIISALTNRHTCMRTLKSFPCEIADDINMNMLTILLPAKKTLDFKWHHVIKCHYDNRNAYQHGDN